MLKKTLTAIGVTLFSLTTALPICAQEMATLALRNGERPSGELIDLNGSGFTLRINGQDRQFPAGDVAAVEFVVGPLPADAQAKVNAGQPIVLLRNGQVIEGRLTDVGGTRPLRLTVDTSSGQREFTSNDVAQLHLRPLNGPAAAAQAPQPGTAIPAGAITVPANQAWTDTGMTVGRGSRVQFAASGDIMISSTASSGPGGSPAVTVPASRYPLRGAPVGALIGRIGTGAPFLIGVNTQPIQMPGTGRLMLGINDDRLPDNTGSYSVTATLVGR
jgi:hypothetical protein